MKKMCYNISRCGGVAQLGERSVRIREVESSNLFVSTKWTLDEHLLFSRRLCRDGAVPIIKKRESRFIALALVLSYPLSCLVLDATARTPVGLPRSRSIRGSPEPETGRRTRSRTAASQCLEASEECFASTLRCLLIGQNGIGFECERCLSVSELCLNEASFAER